MMKEGDDDVIQRVWFHEDVLAPLGVLGVFGSFVIDIHDDDSNELVDGAAAAGRMEYHLDVDVDVLALVLALVLVGQNYTPQRYADSVADDNAAVHRGCLFHQKT
mmetsp:Transcript_12143/g.15041  ORF Transcript_12143/g.15041 Transcript_12143/m.15041 type:complete len:105 (+) Transcript_12143:840-1154(+)